MDTRWAYVERNTGEYGTKRSSSSSSSIGQPFGRASNYYRFQGYFSSVLSSHDGSRQEEGFFPVNPNFGIVASKVSDFTRMNPLKFYISKVEEVPQEFIDEVDKVLMIMGMTLVKKAE